MTDEERVSIALRALSLRLTAARLAAAMDSATVITPEAMAKFDEMRLLSASLGLQLHVARTRQRFRQRTG